MFYKSGWLTSKGIALAILVSVFTPSLIHGNGFSKKESFEPTVQEEKAIQLVPIVITILEFMTIKVASDTLIDWLKNKYGEAYREVLRGLDLRGVAKTMDKKAIALGRERISINDFIRRYK